MSQLLALGLVAILGCGLGGCGKRSPAEPSLRSSDSPKNLVGKLAEASPPQTIQILKRELEVYQPQVKILSPQPGEVLPDNQVSIRFQVQDLPLFKDEALGLGPHLHVILDNQPYRAVYDTKAPLVLTDLEPGTHTLRAFASRPWHESFKNEGAYAQTTFHIFTQTPDNNPDGNQPLLTYSRPKGDYGAEPVLLDFYLTNAPLHLVAQENPTDEVLDWQIRCTVNGESFVFDRWEPIYLEGLKPGKNWVKLELIDENGNLFPNTFNSTVRLINYQPDGQDTLSKLVRGELTAAEARGMIDPNYQPALPEPEREPAPTPSPEVVPLPEPEPEPEIELLPEVPSPLPLVAPELEASPDTAVETAEPEQMPATEPDVEPEAELEAELEELEEEATSASENTAPAASPAKGFFNRFRRQPIAAPEVSPQPELFPGPEPDNLEPSSEVTAPVDEDSQTAPIPQQLVSPEAETPAVGSPEVGTPEAESLEVEYPEVDFLEPDSAETDVVETTPAIAPTPAPTTPTSKGLFDRFRRKTTPETSPTPRTLPEVIEAPTVEEALPEETLAPPAGIPVAPAESTGEITEQPEQLEGNSNFSEPTLDREIAPGAATETDTVEERTTETAAPVPSGFDASARSTAAQPEKFQEFFKRFRRRATESTESATPVLLPETLPAPEAPEPEVLIPPLEGNELDTTRESSSYAPFQ